jgi:MFS family permease
LLVIPLLYWSGHLSFPALLAATFAMGSFTAPYMASAALVVPEVVGDDERLVARASAIVGTSQQFTQIFGPVLAGVVIALTSPATVLVIDGGTFVFSFLTILLTVRASRRVQATPESEGVLAGVRYVLRDALLGRVVIAACVLNAVVQGLVVGLNALAYFHYSGNPHVAGFLFGALGVGALVGAVVAQQLTKKGDLLKIAALAIVAASLPIWLLAIAMPWFGAVLVIGAFAFFLPLVNSPLLAVFTVRTPAELRPKVMTAMITLSTCAGPLGFIAAGQALAHVSVYLVFFVVAAALTASAIPFSLALLRGRAATDLVAVPDVAHG